MAKDKKPPRTPKVKDNLAPLAARVKRKASKSHKSTSTKSTSSIPDFDWYTNAKEKLSIANKREKSGSFSEKRVKKLPDDIIYGNDSFDDGGEFDEY